MFLLILEKAPGAFFTSSHETLDEATRATRSYWGSWIIYERREASQLSEVKHGGLPFGLAAVRKYGRQLALNAESASGVEGGAVLLVAEKGPGTYFEERFSDERAARAGAKKWWASWVLFQLSLDGKAPPCELATGGMGFAHGAIRRFVACKYPSLAAAAAAPTPSSSPSATVHHDTAAYTSVSAIDGGIKMVAAAIDGGIKMMSVPSEKLRQKADAVLDPLLSQPLRDAVQRLEATVTNQPHVPSVSVSVQSPSEAAAAEVASVIDADEVAAHDDEAKPQSDTSIVASPAPAAATTDPPRHEDGSVPSATPMLSDHVVSADDAAPAPPPPPPPPNEDGNETDETTVAATSSSDPQAMAIRRRRYRLAAALECSDDVQTAEALVALMNECLSSQESGADDLIETLVQTLEAAPPTDKEMVRLRKLSLAMEDGLHGYAVGSAWFAALFTRTERCIEARSRLTELVVEFDPTQREQLKHAGERLAGTALPELLGMLADLVAMLAKLTKDVGVQEASVRTAKGVSAALSITGTVMVFTPLLPVGIGLLAGGAGIGVTTATGDAIGQHAQKTDMKNGLARLSECEKRVLLLLESLILACFPDVPAEDWDAARGAGISFDVLPPEQIGNTLLAITSAGARASAGIASRVGAIVFTRVFSVVGAVISSGDFVYSMLTNSPNRKSLHEVSLFIESKSEQYRTWLVLLQHWLEISAALPPPPAPTAEGAADAEGAGATPCDAPALPDVSPAPGGSPRNDHAAHPPPCGGEGLEAPLQGRDTVGDDPVAGDETPEDSSSGASPEVRRQQSARLKEAMMKAVAEPLSPEAIGGGPSRTTWS